MAVAQASVGVAIACPTSGIIFRPAEAMRQGAATAPQPFRVTIRGRRRGSSFIV